MWGSINSRVFRVPGKLRLHREALSQKTKHKQTNITNGPSQHTQYFKSRKKQTNNNKVANNQGNGQRM